MKDSEFCVSHGGEVKFSGRRECDAVSLNDFSHASLNDGDTI